MLTREALLEFFHAVQARLDSPASLYLVGESALVAEGWREWTDRVVYAVEPGQGERLEGILETVAAELGVPLLSESPSEVIPLPGEPWHRARPVRPEDPSAPHRLRLYHFDPYSTAIRLIARGDEPDYLVVLEYLRQGWMELDELDRLVSDSLPRFSADTLQQDPAEFRRKYKALRQVWLAVARPGAGPELAVHGEAGGHAGL